MKQILGIALFAVGLFALTMACWPGFELEMRVMAGTPAPAQR